VIDGMIEHFIMSLGKDMRTPELYDECTLWYKTDGSSVCIPDATR